jgi:hypothetical protein
MSDFAIGTTPENMVDISTMGLADPKAFFLFGVRRTMINGQAKDTGAPRAIWRWGFIRQAARDALRVYCPGASATVYIRTRKLDNADAFVVYQAIMVWPDDEDLDGFRRIGFEIQFRQLVVTAI